MSDPDNLSSNASAKLDAALFAHPVCEWFEAVFAAPTRPQLQGWPAIARGESTLILAPTGTGKTLAAFLWCVNRLMFTPVPDKQRRCRVLYISPIKALAVDVERNLRAPLVGIAQAAKRLGTEFHEPQVAIRTGDTPPAERSRFLRHPADILITTPESLYLLLTSNAREALRSIEVVVIDEIHALVPGKRGAHLALSMERLEHLVNRPLQEVARYLGGAQPPNRDDAMRRKSKKKSASPDESEETVIDVPEDALSEFEASSFAPVYRPVTIIDASEPKRLDLRVEVPVEDMASLDGFEAL